MMNFVITKKNHFKHLHIKLSCFISLNNHVKYTHIDVLINIGYYSTCKVHDYNCSSN